MMASYPSTPIQLRGNVLLYTAAIALRLLLFSLPAVADTLLQRVELVTPVTSYKRLTEGVFLHQSSVPPYDGGVFHQAPLLLGLFSFLSQFPSWIIPVLYSATDVVVAHTLQKIAAVSQAQGAAKPKLQVEQNETGISAATVAALYLFNPLTILSCISRSTIIFTNVSIVMALLWALLGQADFSMFWAATATYLSIYPAMLVPPFLIILSRTSKVWHAATLYGASLFILLGASRLMVGSWDFLGATYGMILFLTDLTPNVGMFWYFFIEIFDQFRSFFMMVFQFHAFIFVAPLCIKLRHRPVHVVTILSGIMAIFKSYPSAGDATLYLALASIHGELFKYYRYGFLISNLFLYASALAPIFWHLWIYAGSGNANFFYAITLVYNLGQVLFLIDLVYSTLRRDFDIVHPEAIGKQVVQK